MAMISRPVVTGFPSTMGDDIQLNTTTLIHHGARTHGDHEIVYRTSSGGWDRYTYADPYARIKRGANALRSLGVGPATLVGIIDWNQPARVVHDWVRALTTPYPGAFTVLRAHPAMVWSTRLPGPSEPVGDPGELLDLTRDGARIGVRGGSIVVTRMSGSGQEPQDAVQWARGAGVRPGTRFDPVDAAVADWARGEGRQPAVAR